MFIFKNHTLSLITLAITVLASPCEAYEKAKDFTVYNRATGEPIRRDDFDGKVLIIDFVAHWCKPCKISSPQMQGLAEAFRRAGGNRHGVEVVVLAVNVEAKDPELTDQFIDEVGFDLVADSFDWKEGKGLYAQFRDGGLPHFTIINGVKDNNFQQWAVLGDGDGFYPLDTYEEIVNSVKGPGSAGPNIQLEVDSIVRYTPQKYQLFNRDSLRFQSSKLGTADRNWNLEIVNSGSRPLKMNPIRIKGPDAAAFRIRKTTRSSLAPGKSITAKVKFKPTHFGQSNASLLIKSNDPVDPEFRIKLTGNASRNQFWLSRE